MPHSDGFENDTEYLENVECECCGVSFASMVCGYCEGFCCECDTFDCDAYGDTHYECVGMDMPRLYEVKLPSGAILTGVMR